MKLDPYYYARDDGTWIVRGPEDFVLRRDGLDKSEAAIIAKILSHKWEDAKTILHNLCQTKSSFPEDFKKTFPGV